MPTSSDRFRVLTFNMLALKHASGGQRQDVVRQGLDKLQPDVVALQEVTRTAAIDQAIELFGSEFTVIDHPCPSPDGVGACLATRWPVGETVILDLHISHRAEGLPWAAAVALEVLVPPPLGPLLVVHYKPNWQRNREEVRERQAVTAARWIEDLISGQPDQRVVVLGDFDAGPATASMRFWTGLQSLDGMSVCYEDAWEAVHSRKSNDTFSPRNPLVRAGEMPLERGRRIDHVLVRCGPHGPLLDVADCRVVLDQPIDGVWASDHFGILADLTTPPIRPRLGPDTSA